jgi:N-glycosylase/DNA lyase
MFSFQQRLRRKTVRRIAKSCQQLTKLSLDENGQNFYDEDAVHVIERLGKHLTTLVLYGFSLTDTTYLYLNNCAR